jgi:hypothetical protein
MHLLAGRESLQVCRTDGDAHPAGSKRNVRILKTNINTAMPISSNTTMTAVTNFCDQPLVARGFIAPSSV